MGKIYYIMGKSSSGKDTIYQALCQELPELRRVVPYTTRPIRSGEREGIAYHFADETELERLLEADKVIELRAYHTIHGVWKYFTVDDGQIDLQRHDYLMIGTLESYEKMRNYYGIDVVVPIYIEVGDGERLRRALDREARQEHPRYEEMCRRFLADQKDFCEENLLRLGIRRRYENTDMAVCLDQIKGAIANGKL